MRLKEKTMALEQGALFQGTVEFIHVESVIGSGFEVQVADLALRDKVAAGRP
jgi:hypothetical protein